MTDFSTDEQEVIEIMQAAIRFRVKRNIYRVLDGTYSNDELNAAKTVYYRLFGADRSLLRTFCQQYNMNMYDLRKFISLMRDMDETLVSKKQGAEIKEGDLLLLLGGD